MSELERYAIGQAPKTRKTNPNGKSREERAQARALKKEKQAQGLDANQPFALPEGQAEQMHQRQQENFKMMQDAGVLGGIKRDTGSNLDYLRPRSEQAEINQGAQAAGRQKQQDTFARGRAAVAEGKQAQYMRNSENAENVAMRGRFTEDGVTNFFNDRQGAAADIAQGGRPQSDMRTMVLPDGSIGMGVSPGQQGLPAVQGDAQLPTGSGVPMSGLEAFQTGNQGNGVYETDRTSATAMDAADARNFSTQQGIRDKMAGFQFDPNSQAPMTDAPGTEPSLAEQGQWDEFNSFSPLGVPATPPALEQSFPEDAPQLTPSQNPMEVVDPEEARLREMAREQAEAPFSPGVSGIIPRIKDAWNHLSGGAEDLIMPVLTGQPKAGVLDWARAESNRVEADQIYERLKQESLASPEEAPPSPSPIPGPSPSPVPGTGKGISEQPPEQIPVPGTEGTTFEGTLEQLPARVQSGEMTLGMIDRLLQTGTISAAQADVLEALALQLTQQ